MQTDGEVTNIEKMLYSNDKELRELGMILFDKIQSRWSKYPIDVYKNHYTRVEITKARLRILKKQEQLWT